MYHSSKIKLPEILLSQGTPKHEEEKPILKVSYLILLFQGCEDKNIVLISEMYAVQEVSALDFHGRGDIFS